MCCKCPVKLCVPVHVSPFTTFAIAVPTKAVVAGAVDESVESFVGTVIVAPVKSCVPVHVAPAFKFVIAVPTKAVVAGAVDELPAVCVVNVTVAPVNPCVPVHELTADNKFIIAVFTNAVDATNVELSDDDFVKTTKSNKVDADDDNVKFVELPIESVIIAGARKVKRQLISFASTLVVVIVPFSIIEPLSIIISNNAIH